MDACENKLSPGSTNAFVEQYKLAVEMADRISARRGIANTFFLTINTGLAALLGGQTLRWYVAVAGIVLCIAWWALLQSYRALNGAKFTVILAMETSLPERVFGREWDLLNDNPVVSAAGRNTIHSWATRYRELGQVERIVPWVFALIYTAELIRQAT
jgi:hypothetical protein